MDLCFSSIVAQALKFISLYTVHHYSDYSEWTGTTMRYTNAEFTGTAHATFKMYERIRKFKVEKSVLHQIKNWH